MKRKTEGGFIALTSVLIIGAVVLVLGVSLFHSALTDYSISTAFESGQEAAFLADFCLKEGVLKLKENINYRVGEEIKVNDMVCNIGPVEDVGDNTKEISSLGRAGDQPHFSRSSQLVRYVIESKAEDWKNYEELENLKTAGNSLTLEGSKDTVIILNSASEQSCAQLCYQEKGADYTCQSIGTDVDASDGKIWTVFKENEEYHCVQ